MSQSPIHGPIHTGGCLCGTLRYEARGEPTMTGHCYCADCRKASGSGFIPFMSFPAIALTFTGQTRQTVVKAIHGGDSTRNYCAKCSSLVFGGVQGESDSFTIYAGSLDNPAAFKPQIAIFTAQRVKWALIPPSLTRFDALPG